jgi:hypothetical protein
MMRYLRRAISLPPRVAIRKAAALLERKMAAALARRLEATLTTYGPQAPPDGSLYRYLPAAATPGERPNADTIAAVAAHYLAHRFDLLGSGWVEVRHGRRYRGVEGHRYGPGSPVEADPEGPWLAGRINRANLRESQRIWRLVDPGYTPIDWQVDFKSGYRWSEATWYRDIPYGHKPGVDVKVPWELARMQHLTLLARAHALAKAGHRAFDPPEVYARECRNEVLDFIATNPPRFGVNWCCAMDVGIRAANWLVALDLFRAAGAEFDPEFLAELRRSLADHGRHIVANLEWDPVVRGNHYLSDVVGLLFVAAYLPRTSEVDAWLAFAVQEVVREVEHQFTPDGANSEASTAYHRLAAELVVYGTALVLGLPPEKQAALAEYDHRLHTARPPLRPAPLPFYPLPGGGQTPFPPTHLDRVERMAAFTCHITRPDGLVPQIGDNDSGRFLKLEPVYRRMSVAEASANYLTLAGYDDLPRDATYWVEEALDHRHLVAAIDGLFGWEGPAGAGGGSLDARLVQGLAGGVRLPAPRAGAAVGRVVPDVGALRAFPDFGLYVYRTARLYVAVRCGPVGQHGNGGHAHNDQLSIEVSIDGVPLVVDPGSHLYTPLPALRNRFRSTAMHSTLAVAGLEQNPWPDGLGGLFTLGNRAAARTIEASDHRYVGEHVGFGLPHRRTLEIDGTTLRGVDECQVEGEKRVLFHLAPDVAAEIAPDSGMPELRCGGIRVRVRGEPGRWSVAEAAYSPGYGLVRPSRILELRTAAFVIRWDLQVVA